MMECGYCKEWVHSHCEGLNDENYQILSFLPDSVEYICKICLKNNPSQWMDAVKKEFKKGIQTVITALTSSRCAKHLLRIEKSLPPITRKALFFQTQASDLTTDICSIVQQSNCELNSLVNTKTNTKEKPISSDEHSITSFESSLNVKKARSICNQQEKQEICGDQTICEAGSIFHSEAKYCENQPFDKCDSVRREEQLDTSIDKCATNFESMINFTNPPPTIEGIEKDTFSETEQLFTPLTSICEVPSVKELEISLNPEVRISRCQIANDEMLPKETGTLPEEKLARHNQETSETRIIIPEKQTVNFCTKQSTIKNNEEMLITTENITPKDEHIKDICCAEPSLLNNCNLANKYYKKYSEKGCHPNSFNSSEEEISTRRLTRSLTCTLKEKDSELKIKNCSVLLVNIANSHNYKLREMGYHNLIATDSKFDRNGSHIENDDLETSSSYFKDMNCPSITLPLNKTNLEKDVTTVSKVEELKMANYLESQPIESLGNAYSKCDANVSEANATDMELNGTLLIGSKFHLESIDHHSQLQLLTCSEAGQSGVTCTELISELKKPTLPLSNNCKCVNHETKDLLNSIHDVCNIFYSASLVSEDVRIMHSPVKTCLFDNTDRNQEISLPVSEENIVETSQTINGIDNAQSLVEAANMTICNKEGSESPILLSSANYVADAPSSKMLNNTNTDAASYLQTTKEATSVNTLGSSFHETNNISMGTPSVPHVARVCKDIDDDCLSSEASSVCGSDTEIESLFDDSDETRDLLDIKDKIYKEKYESVLQFHIDVIGIFEAGKHINKTQTQFCKTTYMKLMKENFPWFNAHKPNIFSLIDCNRPFPYPSTDHIYADVKPADRYLPCQRSLLGKTSTSPSKGNLSPFKINKIIKDKDLRKCILCNNNGDGDPADCGRLLYLGQDEWLHVNCALWSSEVYEEEDGGFMNVYVAVSRGRQIKCSFCLERGATVGCCHKSCQATFHFMCARNNGAFFGSDKRIFCNQHVSSAGPQIPIEDLRVRRCVFVNMDSEKKRWRQVLSDKVNVIIGSLSITQLGKMFPDLDSDDALIPLDFCCSRMYWSTKDPTRRVEYTCRTKRVNPYQEMVDGTKYCGFHKTIDHSLDPKIVENEMKIVKEWLMDVDRQQLAIQSRHTNIIPPHMCPLYRNILKAERILENNSCNGTTFPARRKLFSPTPSNCSATEEEAVRLGLCLENIIEQISGPCDVDVSHEDMLVEDSELTAMVAEDESNEIMSNMVSADDNEIISMVLRDLPVIESSAPHSPHSSGRASPLNLDFLTSYEIQDLHHKSQVDDKNEDHQFQASYHSLQNNEKMMSNDHDQEPEANLCQKIFDACDPHVQNQLLTMEDAHMQPPCNAEDLQSFVSQPPYDETVSLHHKNDLLTKSVSCMFHDAILASEGSPGVSGIALNQVNTNLFPNMMPVCSSSYNNSYMSPLDRVNILPYTPTSETLASSHGHLLLPDSSFCDNYPVSSALNNCSNELLDHHASTALSSCSNELLELNNFLIGAAKNCQVSSNKEANYYDSNLQSLNCGAITQLENTMRCGTVAQLENSINSVAIEQLEKTMNEPLSLIVNGLMNLDSKNNIPSVQVPKSRCPYEGDGLSSSNERSAGTSSRESPFSSMLPSSSSSSTPSFASTKKQVCRVLPMPNAGSRRPSSASEQSDVALPSPLISNQIPYEGGKIENNIVSSKSLDCHPVKEKNKGNIRMKRNYRTVIKKYPLRSSLRKHSSFKSVQIEINETIEIPSEDDDNDCHNLKRKWSSTVTESNGIHSQHAHLNLPSGSKRQRNSIFHASVDDVLEEESSHRPNSMGNSGGETQPQNKSKTDIGSNRSHQVLKFSDDHNDITVSIVNNNNLRGFSKRKKRQRFRRKTVLQLDGAADGSSSSSEETENKFSYQRKSNELHQSNLALHIKQQSLARSSPGVEGPYKCDKCKRLYRTKDSYTRHTETCTFEIDSSTPTEEDSENNSSDSQSDLIPNQVKEEKIEQNLNHGAKDQLCDPILTTANNLLAETIPVNIINRSNNPTDIEKLEHFCSSPLLEETSNEISTNVSNAENFRVHGMHRQVRIALKKGSEKLEATVPLKVEPMNVVRSISPNNNEVFVPPSKSPIKFSPTVKKSASPRKYTNVRLNKGKGYQYRRALPQLLPQSQMQSNALQFRPPHSPQLQSHQVQQASLPIAIQPLIDPNTYNIQHHAFPTQSFQGPISHYGTLNSNMGMRNHMANIGQVLTVVSGPSVAVPQGYTLQYVGSYRDSDVGTSTTNLLTYQAPQSVVVPPLVMTPQPTSMVMPPVLNTNITYAIGPETLVINQPQTLVPNLQYITQPQTPVFQQQMLQSLNNTIVPMTLSSMQQMGHMTQTFNSLPLQTNVAMQQLTTTAGGMSLPIYNSSSLCSQVVISTASEPIRNKPQAFVAPITSISSPLPTYKLESSLPVRPIFSQLPPVSRSVATVAPAVFTSSASIVNRTNINDAIIEQNITIDEEDPSNNSDKDFDKETYQRIATVRPRPTYSYRDAMMDVKQDGKRLKSDFILIENEADPSSAHERKLSEDETDSEKEERKTIETNESKTETQSFKLVLKKDCQSGSKFNILPLTVPNIQINSPEVKELRIKAKVSVGPKRKKTNDNVHRQWGQYGKDFIIGSSDTTNEMSVNEQMPNLSLNFSPNSSPVDDSALIDKPKSANPEPYIVFELTSEDGFKVESRHVTEVWQKVFDAVSEARENLRVGGAAPVEPKGKNMSGLYMLGLTHNAVQYLLEQLPGAKDCHKYSFQFHKRPNKDDDELASASGCARTEAFKIRAPYDIFSWLASKHRKLPVRAQVQQEEVQLSLSTRRATSMELPMAMRYRHLCETAREAVGVFRSLIHGRGLFCKRDIDSGEMVIEYAGQVIRSCLCDMREKFYESKGIGCYMFRIDEETVIDATMHGNAARFINHSCDPNCFSRVVDILGKKHIIIFALRRILRGEELTYDYKFPIEDDKIPCSCGARKCRKYLN